jgi:hypothetical protein
MINYFTLIVFYINISFCTGSPGSACSPHPAFIRVRPNPACGLHAEPGLLWFLLRETGVAGQKPSSSGENKPQPTNTQVFKRS